jgi:hypothetical protein
MNLSAEKKYWQDMIVKKRDAPAQRTFQYGTGSIFRTWSDELLFSKGFQPDFRKNRFRAVREIGKTKAISSLASIRQNYRFISHA